MKNIDAIQKRKIMSKSTSILKTLLLSSVYYQAGYIVNKICRLLMTQDLNYHDRYTIESFDGHMHITGNIDIDECIKFINFCKTIGYKKIIQSYDEGIILSKKNACYDWNEKACLERNYKELSKKFDEIAKECNKNGQLIEKLKEKQSYRLGQSNKHLMEANDRLIEDLNKRNKELEKYESFRRVLEQKIIRLEQQLVRVKEKYIKDLSKGNTCKKSNK